MDGVLAGPEESPTSSVQGVDGASRKEQGGHEVRGHAIKHRVQQDQPSSMVK